MQDKEYIFATPSWSRREFLAGMAVLIAKNAFAGPEASLKMLGAGAGIVFGCAVSAKDLKAFPDLGPAIARDCAIVVPENDMKWGAVEAVKDSPAYDAAEVVVGFAASHGMALRGHTAVWYLNMPAWASVEIKEATGRDAILKRVRDVVGYFRGRVSEWDVVNEMIDHKAARADGMRDWPPFAPGDIGFVADCFFAAREADPVARLVYNDFGFEYLSDGENQRRSTALKLIEELKKRGAPVDGFGIQCHLKVGNNFKPRVFRRFLSDIAALGLHISLTELDIDDQRLPAHIETRDLAVADHARRFLDIAFDEPAVKMLLTWGFSNRLTWLNAHRARADGLKHRPLPLDEDMKPTPLWHAIADSLKNAPDRRQLTVDTARD